tara:strand:- start:1216 stop:1632 length:417 start_codon:yes stop_codon:yes gene_type:complete
MDNEQAIKEKVYDIEIVKEDLKSFPHTYKTILRQLQTNGTLQTILRRKMSKLCKNGEICKTSIPGTRFGKAIFYAYPKAYHILVESDRIGSVVYCFFDYRKKGKYYISLKEFWRLESGDWKKYNKEQIIFEGNVLKWI